MANWGFHRTMDASEVAASLKTLPSIGNDPAALFTTYSQILRVKVSPSNCFALETCDRFYLPELPQPNVFYVLGES